jgi:hypothetical protein
MGLSWLNPTDVRRAKLQGGKKEKEKKKKEIFIYFGHR